MRKKKVKKLRLVLALIRPGAEFKPTKVKRLTKGRMRGWSGQQWAIAERVSKKGIGVTVLEPWERRSTSIPWLRSKVSFA